MKSIIPMVLSFLLLFIIGCSQEEMFKKHVSEEEIAFSKHYFSLFRDKNYEGIIKPLNPQVVTDELPSQLVQIARFFPSDEPRSIEIVDWRTTFCTNKKKQGSLTFQYEFPSSWLLATIIYEQGDNGDVMVNGINVTPIQDSLANINRFTLAGKSLVHYCFLLFFAAIFIFIIITFIYCLRTSIAKRKWLWAALILIGFVQISLNWTSGLVNIKPMGVQLLGVGYRAQGSLAGHGPWIIELSIPLGAILFWIRRSKMIKAAEAIKDQPDDGKDMENGGGLTK